LGFYKCVVPVTISVMADCQVQHSRLHIDESSMITIMMYNKNLEICQQLNRSWSFCNKWYWV